MEQEFNTEIEWDEKFINKLIEKSECMIDSLQRQIRHLKNKENGFERTLAASHLMILCKFIGEELPRMRQLYLNVGVMVGSRMFPDSDAANSYLEGLHHPITNSSYTPEKDREEEERGSSSTNNPIEELLDVIRHAANRGNVRVARMSDSEEDTSVRDSEVNRELREKLLKEIETQE